MTDNPESLVSDEQVEQMAFVVGIHPRHVRWIVDRVEELTASTPENTAGLTDRYPSVTDPE